MGRLHTPQGLRDGRGLFGRGGLSFDFRLSGGVGDRSGGSLNRGRRGNRSRSRRGSRGRAREVLGDFRTRALRSALFGLDDHVADLVLTAAELEDAAQFGVDRGLAGEVQQDKDAVGVAPDLVRELAALPDTCALDFATGGLDNALVTLDRGVDLLVGGIGLDNVNRFVISLYGDGWHGCLSPLSGRKCDRAAVPSRWGPLRSPSREAERNSGTTNQIDVEIQLSNNFAIIARWRSKKQVRSGSETSARAAFSVDVSLRTMRRTMPAQGCRHGTLGRWPKARFDLNSNQPCLTSFRWVRYTLPGACDDVPGWWNGSHRGLKIPRGNPCGFESRPGQSGTAPWPLPGQCAPNRGLRDERRDMIDGFARVLANWLRRAPWNRIPFRNLLIVYRVRYSVDEV